MSSVVRPLTYLVLGMRNIMGFVLVILGMAAVAFVLLVALPSFRLYARLIRRNPKKEVSTI